MQHNAVRILQQEISVDLGLLDVSMANNQYTPTSILENQQYKLYSEPTVLTNRILFYVKSR